MPNQHDEFSRRTGHRFNLIIKSLPAKQSDAVSIEDLHAKLKKLGYVETEDQLVTDVSALMGRNEVSTCGSGSKKLYYTTERGHFETRKRTALIMLHNMEISEEDLKIIENIAHKKKPSQ